MVIDGFSGEAASHQIYWRTGGLRAAKRHLGFDAAPYRRRAHESRGVRKFAFDWRQGSRGSGHTIPVSSRSPEALISHDSAPMQSTSVAAQFLTIQAFSRKCPIGHALDISFENWTSSLRIYSVCRFSFPVSYRGPLNCGDAGFLT